MVEVEKFAKNIVEKLKDKVLDWWLKPFAKSKCVYLRVGKENLREVAEILFKELEGKLSTISAVEHLSYIELVYHFTFCEEGVLLNVKVEVEKDKPRVLSLTPIIKGANFIEREIMDLFGVKFEGHPEPKKLILPDSWPEGVYPLRSEYKRVKKHE